MEITVLKYQGNIELTENLKEVSTYQIKLNIGEFKIIRIEYFDQDGDGQGEDLEIYDTEKQKINTKNFNGKTIEEVFIELNIKVEEDCGISLWKCNDISIDNITKNYSKKNQEVTVDEVIGDKWWEKLDKTKEGRPYLELNECNIYGDLLERLIDDMVFGKITIAQYDKKHHELKQGHQHLKDKWCYKKSKLE
tara:strand:- start:261 stop:839 length:579 start_codon:yes stop_codon:yes gene_type:complete